MLERTKEFIKKIIAINDTPESLSRGIAIGFFFGISIFWGLQIVLAILFAQLMKGNKKAAAVMTAISNPVTTPFIYPACYKIGHFIVNDPEKPVDYSAISTFRDILKLGLPFIEAILTGTVIVGLTGGLVCYIAAMKYLHHKKNKETTIR